MAEQHPTVHQLLEGVIEFFESLATADVSLRTEYLTRVALACLRIVEREVRLGPGTDSRQHARLRQLLGGEGALPDLEIELCRRIRAREIDSSDPELRRHLDETASEHLAIDNPKYSGLRAALARRAEKHPCSD